MTGFPGVPVLPVIASAGCICKGINGWYNPLYYPGPESRDLPCPPWFRRKKRSGRGQFAG